MRTIGKVPPPAQEMRINQDLKVFGIYQHYFVNYMHGVFLVHPVGSKMIEPRSSRALLHANKTLFSFSAMNRHPGHLTPVAMAMCVPLVDDLGVSPRAVDKGYTGRKEVCFQVGKSCFHYQLVLLELSKHDSGQGHSN